MIKSCSINSCIIFLISFSLCIQSYSAIGQEMSKDLSYPAFDSIYLQQFSYNKSIPNVYANEILTALSYFPELKKDKIKFRIKRRFVPLATKIKPISILKPRGQRSFVITISNWTIEKYKPILFANLSFSSQVGVLGHELSHVVDFKERSFKSLVGLLTGQFSKRYLDRMENNTDKRCIEHGLGYQLLAWSEEVHLKLNHKTKIEKISMKSDKIQTSEERYMSPVSIKKHMETLEIYK